jgi:hypothetical protein
MFVFKKSKKFFFEKSKMFLFFFWLKKIDIFWKIKKINSIFFFKFFFSTFQQWFNPPLLYQIMPILLSKVDKLLRQMVMIFSQLTFSMTVRPGQVPCYHFWVACKQYSAEAIKRSTHIQQNEFNETVQWVYKRYSSKNNISRRDERSCLMTWKLILQKLRIFY